MQVNTVTASDNIHSRHKILDFLNWVTVKNFDHLWEFLLHKKKSRFTSNHTGCKPWKPSLIKRRHCIVTIAMLRSLNITSRNLAWFQLEYRLLRSRSARPWPCCCYSSLGCWAAEHHPLARPTIRQSKVQPHCCRSSSVWAWVVYQPDLKYVDGQNLSSHTWFQTRRVLCHVTKNGQGRYSFIFARKSSMTYFHETWQVWTLGGPVYIAIVLVDLDLFFKVIDPFLCRNLENKYCHNFVISGPILTTLPRNGLP